MRCVIITVRSGVTVAETEQITSTEVDSRTAAAVPVAAPSLAFTIDFGQNSDKPEITDHWKHLTPYRIHTGVQKRSTVTKSRSTNKQRQDSSDSASCRTKKV